MPNDRLSRTQTIGWLLVGLLLAGAVGLFFLAKNTSVPDFDEAIKPSLVETTTPSHGQLLPEAPVVIVVDTNQDLVTGSVITIQRAGDPKAVLTVGDTTIDELLTSMRRPLDIQAMINGRYTVTYRTCTQPTSCLDGQFQFALNHAQAANFTDLRGQRAVTVDLQDIAFAPRLLRISRGTTVTWTNHDPIGHYINTDAHPAHTYYPPQNSEFLTKGDSFSLQFLAPGYYPYHCSAHTEMAAAIIVD